VVSVRGTGGHRVEDEFFTRVALHDTDGVGDEALRQGFRPATPDV
jgi:hypothetical protein